MGRFLGGIIKWIAVPVAVGCAGYYLVAPSILPTSKPAIAPPITENKTEALQTGPSVDVAVETPEPSPPRRRRKKKPKPPVTQAPQEQPPAPEELPATDGGGSGGAATAGGDGLPPETESRIG